MTRRSLLRTFAGAGAALVATSVGANAALAEHTSQQYTVSANANFRTGPGTNHAIITVVKAGATFTINGQTQNGYASITYNGRSGWVLASLVVQSGSHAPSPVISGEGWTTTSVNLRSGPSTSHQVLRVVPTGSKIGTSTTVNSGFRYVNYQGQTGWMSDAYISSTKPGGQGPVPSYQTTTANLNLRAEPSTSAKILLVMPAGSRVTPNGALSNGFAQVTSNGTTGWASTRYLK